MQKAALAIFLLIQGCGGGGGGQKTEAPKPAPQPPPTPPGDPRVRAVQEAFDWHSRLAASAAPFGQAFREVPADASAGYAEGFFTAAPQRFSSMDMLPRPLIRAAAPHGASLDDGYRGLYDASIGPDTKAWNPSAIRRAHGFVFTGLGSAPATLLAGRGILSSIFRPVGQGGQRAFQQPDHASHLQRSFNLKSYLFNSMYGGFVSCTRSVHVARHFALQPGVHGARREEGYVYVAYVNGGLDGSDRSLASMHAYEQEVAVPGMVPAGHIVAYRRMVKSPGGNYPPEFTGPIHVRERLQDLEPAAYQAIIQALSLKSAFTRLAEQDVDWQRYQEKVNEPDYRTQFQREHPAPGDEVIWGH